MGDTENENPLLQPIIFVWPIKFVYSEVLYMLFDRFLLAVESCDLSQADKICIRVSSFVS